jgi:cell division transport system permease protein
MIARVRLLISEALRSLAANISNTIAATLTVLIGMFLLGLLIALGSWVISWSEHVKRELVAHVYFCTPLAPCTRYQTDAEQRKVLVTLRNMDEVKTIRFVSRAEALKEMQRKTPELTKNLSSNPLPDSYEVIPKRGEDVELIAKRLERLKRTGQLGGVEKINYGKKTATKILQIARVIEVVFLIGTILLLISSALLIANTIRLSIFSRRREIEVMKLVGATNWFVRGPFIVEGLVCGIVGSVGAIVLLFVGREVALPRIVPSLGTTADVKAIDFSWTALIVLGAGLLLGALGSGLTIRKFLKV